MKTSRFFKFIRTTAIAATLATTTVALPVQPSHAMSLSDASKACGGYQTLASAYLDLAAQQLTLADIAIDAGDYSTAASLLEAARAFEILAMQAKEDYARCVREKLGIVSSPLTSATPTLSTSAVTSGTTTTR